MTGQTDGEDFLKDEYVRLWSDYGVELEPLELAPAEAPPPSTEIDFTPSVFSRVEGPSDPLVAFVVLLPVESARLKTGEEALWERMLQALSLNRAKVTLVNLSVLAEGGPSQWASFERTLPPSLRYVVFFGMAPWKALNPSLGAADCWGVWTPFSPGHPRQWLITHELGKLTEDALAKKETWNQLKDLRERLK